MWDDGEVSVGNDGEIPVLCRRNRNLFAIPSGSGDSSKVTGEALVGRSLAAFGRPDLQIVGLLPTNLPVIESNEMRLHNLFLLSDGSLSIIDYESEYINYIARVIKRHANQKKLGELKRIKMVVIYTADVERADSVYDLDGLVLNVESAFLVQYFRLQ